MSEEVLGHHAPELSCPAHADWLDRHGRRKLVSRTVVSPPQTGPVIVSLGCSFVRPFDQAWILSSTRNTGLRNSTKRACSRISSNKLLRDAVLEAVFQYSAYGGPQMVNCSVSAQMAHGPS
jgi:hypothetical protein